MRPVFDRVAHFLTGNPTTLDQQQLAEVETILRNRFEMPELADELSDLAGEPLDPVNDAREIADRKRFGPSYTSATAIFWRLFPAEN